MKDFILELVLGEYETGHILAEDQAEFKALCRDEGVRATPKMWEFYQECHDLGPAGFYAEYKDKLNFDPMFIAEYGQDEDDTPSDASIDSANGFKVYDKVHVKKYDFDGKIINIIKSPEGRIIAEVRRDAKDGFFDPYRFDLDELELISESVEEPAISEALSNKEKLKRAYPELNFDTPVTETLTEEIDSANVLKTAVGILYDMDEFILNVMDNEYWLAMGVPDGEFTESSRADAEANYEEHRWLIEDSGEFDPQSFAELADAFSSAADYSAYDKAEVARIENEAQALLDTNISTEPLTEAPLFKNKVQRAADKRKKAETKETAKLQKYLTTMLANDESSKAAGWKYFIDGKWMKRDDMLKAYPIDLKNLTADANLVKRADAIVLDDRNYYVRKGFENLTKDNTPFDTSDPNATKLESKYTYEAIKGKLGDDPFAATTSSAADATTSSADTSTADSASTATSTDASTDPSTSDAAPADTASDTPAADAPAADTDAKKAGARYDFGVSSDTYKHFLKLAYLMKPVIKDAMGNVASLDSIEDLRKISYNNLLDYKIEINGRDVELVDWMKSAVKNKVLTEDIDTFDYDDMIDEDYQEDLTEGVTNDDLKELLTLAQNIGIESVAEMQAFIANEVAPGDSVLDVLRAYRDDLGDDFELKEEVAVDAPNPEFATCAQVVAEMTAAGNTAEEIESTETIFELTAKALKTTVENLIIYADTTSDYDPVYFADSSRMIGRRLAYFEVAGISVVKESLSNSDWLYFKSTADAEAYLKGVSSENI